MYLKINTDDACIMVGSLALTVWNRGMGALFPSSEAFSLHDDISAKWPEII